jgi:hypothetical protein
MSDSNYVLCTQEKENLDDLFLKCSLARIVLFGSDLNLRIKFIYPCSLKQWLAQLMEDPNFHKLLMFSRLFIINLWALWYRHNKVMFEVAKHSSYEVLMLSKALFCRYAQAYDAQQADQSNCWRVCPVVEDG